MSRSVIRCRESAELGGHFGVRPAPESAPVPIPPELGGPFFRQLFDSLYDGVVFVDTARRVRYWNLGAERITGYAQAEVVGSVGLTDVDSDRVNTLHALFGQDEGPLCEALATGQPKSARVALEHRDGRRIAVDVHAVPVRDEAGGILGAIEVFRDATAIVALETAFAKLRELAIKDPLTGLANRRHLDEMLDLRLDLLRRAGLPFCAVMLDIDHFKRINDTWGHAVGDQALIRFAGVVQGQCRGRDVIGRYGGEEYLVLLPEIRLPAAARIAERLRLAVASRAAPAELQPGAITASLGVAEAVPHDTAASLLQRVDLALYRAKSTGRNRVEIQDIAAAAPAHPANAPPPCVKTSRPGPEVDRRGR